ncbi:MAG: amidohydrolase family protein [Acidobacteriota bacterium]
MRIISADYVLPITSGPIYRGAVAIDHDKLIAVGFRDEIVARFPAADEENFGQAAILPGFVNCHSHLEITAMRGLLDHVEHDFASWLLLLNDTRANRLTDSDIELAAIAGAAEGAAGGVTFFGDVGRYGKAGFEALKAVGLRGVLYQETNFSPDDRTAGNDVRELAEKIRVLRNDESSLVKVGVSPHSPYTVSPKLFSMIADLAAAEWLNVSTHASESADEARLMRTGSGFFTGIYEKFGVSWASPRCSSIEFLERTGILKSKPLLAHCVNVSADDIERINDNGATVAHCPKSNAKFGHGWAPLEAMLDAGIAVGLGSDSVASNNMCDMLDEARFAALGARNRPGSERFIAAAEALETATLGGAKAMGLDAEIGSLEAGKQADIAVVSLGSVSQGPVNDVNAALVYSSSAGDVVVTIVAGREIYRKGEKAAFDQSGLAEKLDELRRKIAG